MHTPHLKLTLQGCSLALYYLSFVSNLLSSLLTSVVAKEQGGSRGELVNSTNRMSDSTINNLLFSSRG
jgi:hypothetical protein